MKAITNINKKLVRSVVLTVIWVMKNCVKTDFAKAKRKSSLSLTTLKETEKAKKKLRNYKGKSVVVSDGKSIKSFLSF